MTPIQSPRFKHDCEQCTFLGRFDLPPQEGDVHQFDLYVCGDKPEVRLTVIARYSDEPKDYTSGLDTAIQVRDGIKPVDASGKTCEWPNPALALKEALNRYLARKVAERRGHHKREFTTAYWGATIETAFEKFTQDPEGRGFRLIEIAEFMELTDDGKLKVKLSVDAMKEQIDIFFIVAPLERLVYFSNGYNRIGSLMELIIGDKRVSPIRR